MDLPMSGGLSSRILACCIYYRAKEICIHASKYHKVVRVRMEDGKVRLEGNAVRR